MDYLWTQSINTHKNHVIGQNLQNAKSLETRINPSFFQKYNITKKLQIRTTVTTDRSVGSSSLLWRMIKTS